MDPSDALGAFADLFTRDDDDEIEVERAALLFAVCEYPELDVGAALATLDRFADQLRPRLAGLHEPTQLARGVAEFLHGGLGFSGNAEAYYDPRNSYLNEVLERRRGIPISLSTLYLALGRRVGVPFEGVGLPGHFLVRLRHLVTPVLMDPFEGGLILDEAACEERLRSLYGPHARLHRRMLAPISARLMVYRMLNNLKGIYFGREDWARTIRTVDLMLAAQPGALGEYRDRGTAHMRSGDLRRARADFEHYLLNAPDLDDAGTIRDQLALIERLESRRN